MKIELKPIVDQLTETIGLPKGEKVSAMIEDDNSLIGWMIVKVKEDGTLLPQSNRRYKDIKELMDAYNETLEKEEEENKELTIGDIYLILVAEEQIKNEKPELMVKSDTSLFDAILERYLELKKEI